MADGQPSDPSSVADRLALVGARGAPAQAREAQRLADLAATGVDVTDDAGRLWDAYLNDPYLERG